MGSGAVIHPANCSLEMLKKCHYLSNLQQGDGLMCWEKISLPLPCLSQGTKCTLYSNSAKRFQCIAFYLGSHPANSSIQWDHSHDNINVWVKAFYLRSKIQSRTGAPALNGHTVICKKLGIFYQIWWYKYKAESYSEYVKLGSFIGQEYCSCMCWVISSDFSCHKNIFVMYFIATG